MPITEVKKDNGWFDSHCHLNDIETLIPALNEAVEYNIRSFLIPGTHQQQWPNVIALRADNIRYALGTHPWFVKNSETEYLQLKKKLEAKGPSAVGEIGLDFYRSQTHSRPSHSLQVDSFTQQLELARSYNLPVIIHSVKAHNEVINSIRRSGVTRGVVHAFSGSYEQVKSIVDLGLYVGVGPIILKSKKTRDAVAKIPLDAVLLETDAPYMNNKAGGNPLLDILTVATELSNIHGKDMIEIQRKTHANTVELFG